MRHIERTSVLVHLIDAYTEDIAQAYKTIQAELASYKIDLSKRPQIVVLNKIDGFDRTALSAKISQLQKVIPAKTAVFAISALSRNGIDKLLFEVKEQVSKEHSKQKAKKPKLPVLRFMGRDDDWQVEKIDDYFLLTGRKIERFAARTDFNSVDGVERLRDIMRKMGIMKELERQDIKADDVIYIGRHKRYKLEF